MKGTLIKTDKGYILEGNNLPNPRRLSLRNCEAIELGYDLDELSCKEIKIDISVVNHIDRKLNETLSPCVPLNEGGCVGSNLYNQVKGFQKGFQKALEILGDKKFSEVNMKDAYYFGSRKLRGEYLDFVKTFQQTEWDVEIVTEPMSLDEIREQGKGFLNSSTNKPKLDAQGCLILKRKL